MILNRFGGAMCGVKNATNFQMCDISLRKLFKTEFQIKEIADYKNNSHLIDNQELLIFR